MEIRRLKVLFLIFHGFSMHNGISKKIWGQVRGLKACGADVRLCYYEVKDDGSRGWMVDGEVLVDLGKGKWAKLRKRLDFSPLADYALKERFDMVYIRSYHNASPFFIRFVEYLKAMNTKVVMEIPTFPYDQEYIRKRDKIVQWPDRIFRNQLAAKLDAVITFTADTKIFGQRTIQISNGIDFEALPLRRALREGGNELHLLAVAEIHYWHGFDRLIAGLADYYQSNPTKEVHFHLVGNLSGRREEKEIFQAINLGELSSFVHLYGALSGDALDRMFDLADFAVGSLGRHRSGIKHIRTLKNREYAARGIPFIYSEIDEDFEGKPYIIKAEANESPIDIASIVSFCATFNMSPESIRKDNKSLSWANQMKKVTDQLALTL